jgi:hypothetical protein
MVADRTDLRQIQDLMEVTAQTLDRPEILLKNAELCFKSPERN